jgi:hypothetical protein
MDELLPELRLLAKAFPLPHPVWHPYTSEMQTVVRDLFAALHAIALVPTAGAELLRQIDGEVGVPPPDAGGPAVAAARKRLRELPIPQGEHPYLDEIRPTLEAATAALAALTVPDGEQAFSTQLARLSHDS